MSIDNFQNNNMPADIIRSPSSSLPAAVVNRSNNHSSDTMQTNVALTSGRSSASPSFAVRPPAPSSVVVVNKRRPSLSSNNSRQQSSRLSDFIDRLASCYDTTLDTLSQRISFTYLFILVTIIVFSVLLIVVALTSGLGPPENCQQQQQDVNKIFGGKVAADDQVGDEQTIVVYDRNKPWTNYRLPRSLLPKHYSIELYPRFYSDDERTFDGHVTIEALVVNATRLVILHSLDLNITSTSVTPSTTTDELPVVKRTFPFEPHQYFVIELKQRLKKDSIVEIKLSFTGHLNSASEGFYKAFFRHPSTGKKLFVAVTQFEPLDARRMFPCFDEPNLKSDFTISVRHRRDFKALSNMPPDGPSISDPNDPDMVMTRFQRTPVPMSTYLVALVVGQYAALPSVTATNKESKLPITVYAPEYALEQTQYSLDVTQRIFEWMQRFFIIPYPLPKLDLAVLPSFRWTAMENWGLVTFREDALLVSEETTEIDRGHVVSIISHELAHQWFGNLVTMDWWDDLWLNEGFASYMEFPGSIAVGRMVNAEEYRDYLDAIRDDAFRSSRPIRFLEIRTRNDISSAFDTITYLKGSTIIRMLVNAIGQAKFKNAIQTYMSSYQYKNARTADLWSALSKEYSLVNISQVMTTWVEQKGVPLVTVHLSTNNEDELIISQEPYRIPQWQSEESLLLPETDARRWWIPFNVLHVDGTSQTAWIPPEKGNFSLRLPRSQIAAETKVNLNQTAFIRVNYPTVMWEKFGDKLAMDINAFPPIDRAGLVDDCLELAKSGLVNYSTAFKTIRFLAKETHPLVWEAFVPHANFLSEMLWDSPQYLQLKAWIGATIRSARTFALNNIKSSSSVSSHQDNPNFKRILSILAEASLNLDPGTDAKCYAESYYADRRWELLENRELRRAIFTAYMQSNDTEGGMAELLALAKKTRLKQIQKEIKYAIARTKHFSLLSRELEKVFKDELNPSDFLTLAFYVVNSRLHRGSMWDWAREHFDKLKPYYGGPTIKFMTWFVNIAKYFNTRTKMNEFELFAKTTVRNFGDGLRARRLVEDKIKFNIYWRDNLRKQLEQHLATFKLSPLKPSTVC